MITPFRLALVVGLIIMLSDATAIGPSFAQAPTQPPDFSKQDLKSLGLTPLTAVKDPKSGLIVGGKNATELLEKLAEINGRSIADLEQDMRPDATSEVASSQGFLGKKESLRKVLVDDNRYVVDQLGISHQELARQLFILAALGEKHPGKEFHYHGERLTVTVNFSRGYQLSPFRDGTKSNADVTIQNLGRAKKLAYGMLVPQMIERYGFYEGRETPYRVEPARVIEILPFLAKRAAASGRDAKSSR